MVVSRKSGICCRQSHPQGDEASLLTVKAAATTEPVKLLWWDGHCFLPRKSGKELLEGGWKLILLGESVRDHQHCSCSGPHGQQLGPGDSRENKD